MTKITHWSKEQFYNSIMTDGMIQLEGYNDAKLAKEIGLHKLVGVAGISSLQFKKQTKEKHKWAGQYVWFTEEEEAKCTGCVKNFDKVGFEFDAKEIVAERWTVIAQRQIMKKGSRAKKYINAMNIAAKLFGDDITKWWVIKEPISLEFCQNIDRKAVA
tara:strand:- start:175 stop:651 length:477 start_codon:yes stop_codon:yes gene_type:complete